jgi:hypothetical protein
MTASSMAVSATLRPIGPSVPNCCTKTSGVGPYGTRPCDGRRPTTLFQPGGFRRLPAMSLPSATGTIRSASAAAAPPLLPPAVRDGS